ncbi:phage virion morphogenesis protein [Pseudomonas capeferrum]
MFKKLCTATYMKVRGDSNVVTVCFTGRIARIASVHQFGLKDRAERSAPEIRYGQRELLGFTVMDFDIIHDALLTKLTQ